MSGFVVLGSIRTFRSKDRDRLSKDKFEIIAVSFGSESSSYGKDLGWLWLGLQLVSYLQVHGEYWHNSLANQELFLSVFVVQKPPRQASSSTRPGCWLRSTSWSCRRPSWTRASPETKYQNFLCDAETSSFISRWLQILITICLFEIIPTRQPQFL